MLKTENAVIIVWPFSGTNKEYLGFQLCNLREKVKMKLEAQEKYQKEVFDDTLKL